MSRHRRPNKDLARVVHRVSGDADVRDGVACDAGAGGEVGAADEDMADAGLVTDQADLLCGDEDI